MGQASSGTGKHKREDDYPTVSIIELGDGLQEVLGCLEQPDRLSLATTCKTMVAAVEIYSRVALQQLMEDHVVDEFFEDRTKERFAGKTEEPPSRCLLHAAHSTHLCALEMFPVLEGERRLQVFPGDRGISGEVALSKDGTRLAVAGIVRLSLPDEEPRAASPLKIYIWDLPTKKLLRTLEVPRIDDEYDTIHRVYFVESSIAVCTDQRVLVVAATEEAEPHSCRHQDIESVTQKDSATIVFKDEKNVYSFNILTGEKKSIASLPSAGWWWLHGVLHDRWLIGSNNGTIFNLDLQNGLAIAASHCGLVVSFNDGPGTIHFLKDNDKMEALVVNASTGKFQKVDQFPVDVEANSSCRGIVGPHVFFERNHDHHNAEEKKAFLVALSTKTKGWVRSLQFPPNRHCHNVPHMVQSNGKEFFVSVKPRDPQTPRGHGVELLVYSA